MYEVRPTLDWRVTFDNYITTFSGMNSEQRAKDYCSWLNADWRVGQAVTPKRRNHQYYRKIGVIRKVNQEIAEVELYEGEKVVRLVEATEMWMTA